SPGTCPGSPSPISGSGSSRERLSPLFPCTRMPASRPGRLRISLCCSKCSNGWQACIFEGGKLHLAYQLCQSGLTGLAQVRSDTFLGGYLSYWLTRVLYEWDRLDEARTMARKLLHDAQIWQQLDLQLEAYLRWVEIECAAGELASAQHVMQQVTALIQETG